MVATIHVTKEKYPSTDQQLLRTCRKLGYKLKTVQNIPDYYLIKLHKVCAIKNACNKLELDDTVNILLEENPISFQVKKIRGGSVSFKGVEISEILDLHDSKGRDMQLTFNHLERSNLQMPEGVTYYHPLTISKQTSITKGLNEEKMLYKAFSTCSIEQDFSTFLKGINERYIWACQEACAVMYQWLKE